jgi:PBP1b-binding outer membrane lipoprotein LpoB
MGVRNASTILLAVLFIQGCSSPAQPPDTPPAPPQKTVFDPLTQDIDKARGVQNTVDQQAESTRRNLDSQERGDAPQ